jgi:hypothetical protein
VTAPREDAEFAASLALLGGIVAFAVAGLLLAGNLPKAVRVTAAAGAYVVTLLALPGARRSPRAWWPFAAAGGAAGVVSAAMLPARSLPHFAVSVASAALLLGSVHWVALRYWGIVRERITR